MPSGVVLLACSLPSGLPSSVLPCSWLTQAVGRTAESVPLWRSPCSSVGNCYFVARYTVKVCSHNVSKSRTITWLATCLAVCSWLDNEPCAPHPRRGQTRVLHAARVRGPLRYTGVQRQHPPGQPCIARTPHFKLSAQLRVCAPARRDDCRRHCQRTWSHTPSIYRL
jgi:hypothetical protein